MAGATGKRRVMLLFTVLAGLFLMHGLSAPSMHGMPMPAASPMPMPTASSMPSSMAAAMPTSATAAQPQLQPQADADPATAGSSPDPMSAPMRDSMACVPLRPVGMAGLFLALFLIVTTPWRLQVPFTARLMRLRWPHGPPRTGVQILHTLSVSRT